MRFQAGPDEGVGRKGRAGCFSKVAAGWLAALDVGVADAALVGPAAGILRIARGASGSLTGFVWLPAAWLPGCSLVYSLVRTSAHIPSGFS